MPKYEKYTERGRLLWGKALRPSFSHIMGSGPYANLETLRYS